MDIEGIEIVQEAHEAKLLKQYLFKKLKGFCGINHVELEDICAMFGILEAGVEAGDDK